MTLKLASRPRLDSLQVCRAFAALYVVIFHVQAVGTDKLGFTATDLPIISAGHAGVNFFFALSGFIMAYIHWGDLGHPERLLRYGLVRIARIYPTFWIVLGITVLGQLALSNLDPLLGSPLGVIRTVLLLPFKELPPLVVAWTLSHELLFYLLLGLCFVSRGSGLILLVCWQIGCGLVAVLQTMGLGALSFPLGFLFSPFNLLFGFGIITALTFQRLSANAAKIVLATGLAGFLTLVLNDAALGDGFGTLAYGLAAAAILAGCARLQTGRQPWPLILLGDASYSIYLWHSSVMALAAIFMRRVGIDVMLGQWLTMALLFSTAVAMGLAFYWFVERPMLVLLRRRIDATAAAPPRRSKAQVQPPRMR